MRTQELIRAALAEDIGRCDITTALTVGGSALGRGRIKAREPGVISGLGIAAQVFHALDRGTMFTGTVRDSAGVRKGTLVAVVEGKAVSILTGERTALNFLQRLSGIATLTRRFVNAVKGTGAVILDTRKTTPGWRELEKYAVRCGGGSNHRMGLYDMVLVKDNHVAAAGSVRAAVELTRDSKLPVEVEVRNLAQLREALDAGARRMLLDNMSLAQLRKAREVAGPKVKLEASGGINLRRVRQVAETGVDYISVGELTHSAPALDIALDLEPVPGR
ncbi:MAG: carboxylating nicotinate-nucleotide diphosphorylase [candidate division WOR-3 bacterium]|nr:MAG: carboxylating nicotinate-nucleotide diphosphorylase [candidate division WOR-3 bacterium]